MCLFCSVEHVARNYVPGERCSVRAECTEAWQATCYTQHNWSNGIGTFWGEKRKMVNGSHGMRRINVMRNVPYQTSRSLPTLGSRRCDRVGLSGLWLSAGEKINSALIVLKLIIAMLSVNIQRAIFPLEQRPRDGKLRRRRSAHIIAVSFAVAPHLLDINSSEWRDSAPAWARVSGTVPTYAERGLARCRKFDLAAVKTKKCGGKENVLGIKLPTFPSERLFPRSHQTSNAAKEKLFHLKINWR